MKRLFVAAALAAFVAVLGTPQADAMTPFGKAAPDSVTAPHVVPVTPQCGDGCGGGGGDDGGGGGCDSSCGSKGDRPGNGYGDKNHDHTGPPGQDGKGNCDHSCYSGW